MIIAVLVLLTMLTGSTDAVRSDCVPMPETQQSNASSGQLGRINSSQIKITIATGGVPYGPAKDTFRVGEKVPLVITMTNTGSEPVYVCQSGTLYQDRPHLLRNDEPVPYASFRQTMMQTAEKNRTCQELNLPQQVLLRPNEPTVVDWFHLAQGTNSLYENGWYGALPAGNYKLTNQRRLSCCDGSLTESNTIEFVVVP